ncbi:MAG: hypothetical protein QOI40_1187 [Alphaproteobacteria bacterium]|jgi:uncharacterized membrane protein|nr:hypothetical protein [Alphaproteobacteria bacterium]
MPEQIHAHRRLPMPIRIVRARPRLFISALVVVVVIALCPSDWRIATRLLVGWDFGLALYLGLLLHMMSVAEVRHIRMRAKLQDEGQITVLTLTAIAALASLGAIVALLGMSEVGNRDTGHLTLALTTIFLSWMFTHSMFALHYAHEFYDENGGKGGGLMFPGDLHEPDYWDFVYFSFVIGMTSQVSDIVITCRPIRHTVTAHGVISFFFNVTLLALTVNIAASAI